MRASASEAVTGLDVAVQHVFVVHVLHGVEDALHDRGDLLLREGLVRVLALLDELLQRLSLDLLHDDVPHLFRLAKLRGNSAGRKVRSVSDSRALLGGIDRGRALP